MNKKGHFVLSHDLPRTPAGSSRKHFSSLLRQTKGWIKIVEAVVGIMLLAGVILIVISERGTEQSDLPTRVHDLQVSVLREIELDDSMRTEIVGTFGEVEFGDFPTETGEKITSETPNYLDCTAKICNPGDSCLLEESPDGEVYTESVIITATLSEFNPRVLKIFCWEN